MVVFASPTQLIEPLTRFGSSWYARDTQLSNKPPCALHNNCLPFWSVAGLCSFTHCRIYQLYNTKTSAVKLAFLSPLQHCRWQYNFTSLNLLNKRENQNKNWTYRPQISPKSQKWVSIWCCTFLKIIPWALKERYDVIQLRLHSIWRAPSGDRAGILL